MLKAALKLHRPQCRYLRLKSVEQGIRLKFNTTEKVGHQGNLTVSTFQRPKNKEKPRESVVEIPTTQIPGLNFPPSEHAKYHAGLLERASSVVAFSPIHEPVFAKRAQLIASQLGIKIAQNLDEAYHYDFILTCSTQITLKPVEKPPLWHKSGPIYANFVDGEAESRRRLGKMTTMSPMIRAVNISKPFNETKIIDATGGLGVDAYVLASMGFQVTVLERDPIVYTLLRDGYERGKQHPEIAKILSQMHLVHVDAHTYFNSQSWTEEDKPDVIYIDPMYPHRTKLKHLPKKEMSIARRFLPKSEPIEEFLAAVSPYAKSRVVIKRPYYAEETPGQTTHFKGRDTRFEVFQQ